MLYVVREALEHTLLDSVKLVPFLFLTYLAMEYLEHRAGDKAQRLVQKSGRLGPVIGGLLGVVPQCGFSAAASNLYAGRVITLGTLLAIYLSTSDEMLPILISEQAPVGVILAILLMKAGIGMVAGCVIDLLLPPKQGEHPHIHELCEHEHCNCEKGIFRSALKHTLHILFFIIVIGFAVEFLLHFLGEDALAKLLWDRPVLGPVLAGLVGLIPNCAASVAITQLYLAGVLSMGAMMAGLLVGAGVGLMVLLRVNADLRENLKIIGLLYGIGVAAGIVIDLLG